jgi:amino acid transporter
MSSNKNKKTFFIFISIILIIASCYFFLATINTAVSKKYGIFNPTESHYYSTLSTETEKMNYVNEIEHNNLILKVTPIIYLILTIASFISAILIVFYRKKLSESKYLTKIENK